MKNRQSWGTDLNLGGALNRGNVDQSYVSGDVAFIKMFSASSIYVAGALTYLTFAKKRLINEGSSTLRYDHWLSENWRLFAFTSHAYNQFLRLRYRATAGAGPWYDLHLGPTVHGLSAAVTYEYELFRHDPSENTPRLSLRLASEFPFNDIARLSVDVFYVPALPNARDVRWYGMIAFETLFWKDVLGLKLTWAGEYDSRPKPTIKKEDMVLIASLAWHLGQ